MFHMIIVDCRELRLKRANDVIFIPFYYFWKCFILLPKSKQTKVGQKEMKMLWFLFLTIFYCNFSICFVALLLAPAYLSSSFFFLSSLNTGVLSVYLVFVSDPNWQLTREKNHGTCPAIYICLFKLTKD